MEPLDITLKNGDTHTAEFRLHDGRKLAGVVSASIDLAVARVPTVDITLTGLSVLSLDGVASNVFVLTEEEMRQLLADAAGLDLADISDSHMLRARRSLHTMRSATPRT